MKRISDFFDNFWKLWDGLFEGVEKDIKELEAQGGTKTVVTEERDGFTYKTTTITAQIRGAIEGDGYFSARQVASALARRYDTDYDDWVAERLAVLRAQGEKAKARVVWVKRDGKYSFQIMVIREDGRIENTRQPQN